MVYGGFNGQTKDRVIVFHPGQFGNVKEHGSGGLPGELPRPQVCLEQEEGAVQGLECGGQEEQCRAPDQEQHWGLQVATVVHCTAERYTAEQYTTEHPTTDTLQLNTLHVNTTPKHSLTEYCTTEHPSIEQYTTEHYL